MAQRSVGKGQYNPDEPERRTFLVPARPGYESGLETRDSGTGTGTGQGTELGNWKSEIGNRESKLETQK